MLGDCHKRIENLLRNIAIWRENNEHSVVKAIVVEIVSWVHSTLVVHSYSIVLRLEKCDNLLCLFVLGNAHASVLNVLWLSLVSSLGVYMVCNVSFTCQECNTSIVVGFCRIFSK